MTPARRHFVLLQLTGTTVLGFAATDLVLPAIPDLPRALQGTATQAQYVLAAFVAGFAAGLLLFGELGARFHQRRVLGAALVVLAAVSLLAARAESLPDLVALRFLQGAAAAAGAAFAPGVIRTVFDERQALRAMGLQGSVESLVPALAPLAGAWLVGWGGWRSSFVALAALALLMALSVLGMPRTAFPAPQRAAEGYLHLLRHPPFLRWGLSQACTLGGLLVFVLGAPAVIVRSMDGVLGDFVLMQVLGVSSFIAAASLTQRLCRRFGDARMVRVGSTLSAAGACALLAYALAGGRSPLVVALLFVPVNLGLGLRGPPGFLRAIVAGGGGSRAAALVILAILLVTAGGTALVAPWIDHGLLPLAATTAAISLVSVALVGRYSSM